MAFTERYTGQRELLSWGVETTFGTPATPDTFLGLNATVIPTTDANFLEVQNSGADSREIEYEKGVNSYGGTLKYTPQNWEFLINVIGASTDTGSDPYTHTFAVSDVLPTFTLQQCMRGASDFRKLYTSCKVTKFIFDVKQGGTGSAGAQGGFINCSADFVAKTVDKTGSLTAATNPATKGFRFEQAQFKIDNTVVASVVEGTFTIEPVQQIDRFADYNGSGDIGEPVDIRAKYYGNLKVNLSDSTYWDLFEAGATIANCSIEFKRGTNDNLMLSFTDFYLQTDNDATNLDGVNTADLVFRAEKLGAVAIDSMATYNG